MKKIKLIFILTLVGMLLIGCKSKGTRVQEQLDLGAKYMEDLDYESAIVALNKAIQIDPKNVEAYTMLAELYEKSGRVDEARETLEMALDIAGLSSKKEEEINKRLKNLEFLVMISETPGEYDEPKSIELRNENDYDIYYTIETKENRLVATDLKYTEPILLDEDGKYILKAYTVDDDNEKHNEIVVKYTLKLAKEHTEKDSWENVGDIYRYRGKDGKIVTGWLEIDGDWYYFTDKGNMATGPQDIDGKQYYFGEDGVMLTGWQQINGKWYYLGEDGVIKSGPQSIDGKWYYFGEDGTMETGWKQIGDKWYYLLDTGEFSIGWQNIGGKWYYFASNGEMKTDQYIDGYYIGADGVMTTEGTNSTIESSENTDYKKLYRDVLTKLYTKHKLEGIYDYGDDTEMEINEYREPKYTLLDITGDGKEELIIYAGIGVTGIYGIKNGKISVLLNTYMDDGCYILDNNSIVVTHRIPNTAPHTGPTNSGTEFVLYIYNQQSGKFEMYGGGEAINPESDEYNAEDSRYFNDLMSKVVMKTFEGANIPVTPENIAKIK